MTMAPGAPVITRLMGGLGNQMFQYAAGYALAQLRHAPLLIDRSHLDDRPAGMTWTPRDLELQAFDLSLSFADAALVNELRRVRRPVAFRRQTWFRERDKRCDPGFFNLTAPVLLEGFWQSEGYFRSIVDEVRERLFQHRGQPSADNVSLADAIRNMISASVHVRCGDYLTDPAAAAFHGRLSPEYYASAATELKTRVGVEHFFVFSDEPEKARDHVKLPGAVTFVEHNSGGNQHWDLWLMRQCRHHIIANSSFSWWGAWLSKPAGKTVIAPKTWFAGDDRPNDIIPSTWLQR